MLCREQPGEEIMQKAATYFPLLIVLWSCANSELTPLAPEKLDGNYDKVTIDWRGEMAGISTAQGRKAWAAWRTSGMEVRAAMTTPPAAQ